MLEYDLLYIEVFTECKNMIYYTSRYSGNVRIWSIIHRGINGMLEYDLLYIEVIHWMLEYDLLYIEVFTEC